MSACSETTRPVDRRRRVDVFQNGSDGIVCIDGDHSQPVALITLVDTDPPVWGIASWPTGDLKAFGNDHDLLISAFLTELDPPQAPR